jgi:hypothetical protein
VINGFVHTTGDEAVSCGISHVMAIDGKNDDTPWALGCILRPDIPHTLACTDL